MKGTGRLVLAEAIAADDDIPRLLRLAASLVAGSDHPLADAVRDYAEALGVVCVAAPGRRVFSGRARARIEGDLLSLVPLGAADDVPFAPRWAQADYRVWVLRRRGAAPLGWLAAAEAIGAAGNSAARPAVSSGAAQ